MKHNEHGNAGVTYIIHVEWLSWRTRPRQPRQIASVIKHATVLTLSTRYYDCIGFRTELLNQYGTTLTIFQNSFLAWACVWYMHMSNILCSPIGVFLLTSYPSSWFGDTPRARLTIIAQSWSLQLTLGFEFCDQVVESLFDVIGANGVIKPISYFLEFAFRFWTDFLNYRFRGGQPTQLYLVGIFGRSTRSL